MIRVYNVKSLKNQYIILKKKKKRERRGEGGGGGEGGGNLRITVVFALSNKILRRLVCLLLPFQMDLMVHDVLETMHRAAVYHEYVC